MPVDSRFDTKARTEGESLGHRYGEPAQGRFVDNQAGDGMLGSLFSKRSQGKQLILGMAVETGNAGD